MPGEVLVQCTDRGCGLFLQGKRAGTATEPDRKQRYAGVALPEFLRGSAELIVRIARTGGSQFQPPGPIGLDASQLAMDREPMLLRIRQLELCQSGGPAVRDQHLSP